MGGASVKSRIRFSVRIVVAGLWLLGAASAHAATAFYSDLDSGPNIGGQNNKGVFVTVWGKGFGATRGSGYVSVGGSQVDNYPAWSDSKIAFQLGANATSGDIVVHTASGAASNGVPFTVRVGRVLFVTPNGIGDGSFASPMSPFAAWNGMQPGDTYYFRAGNYTGQYGSQSWGQWNMTFNVSHTGTVGNPVALSAYPGETVAWTSPSPSEYGNFGMIDGDGHGDYVTIANFILTGGTGSIGGGGWYSGSDLHRGAVGVRVVGNVISTRYHGTTGGSGAIMPQNDHWRVFGNELKNIGDCIPTDSNGCNLNHAIYAQLCTSDLDIGWNYFHDLIMGHVILVHMDIPCNYYDVRIHDNVLVSANVANTRGISASLMSADSYGAIYNNVLYNLGQGFAGLSIYYGNWKVYNNTFYNVHAPSGIIWLSGNYGGAITQSTAQVFNNIFYADEPGATYVAPVDGASWSRLALANNLYFNGATAPSQDANAVTDNPSFVNPATGNFRLQSTSQAIDRGTSLVAGTVAIDADGVVRPQGGGYDIGAFEFSNGNQPPVANAGADVAVNEGGIATLGGSGSDSDGSISAYAWTQTAGPTVSLSGANTASASFTAPQVSADTVLTFRLTVTDNQGATGSDTVNVTIHDTNVPPTANAGPDQTVTVGASVTLTGSGSTGAINAYQWTQIAGPSVTLTGAATTAAKFTAPSVSVDTTLSFRLTVTGSNGATSSDTVNVIVHPAAVVNPDLAILNVSTSATEVNLGQRFTISNTVKNQSTIPVTSSFAVRLYLSTDSTITTADTVLATRTVSSLSAGGSSSASTSIKMPTKIAPGTYYIGAIADYANVIAESNESNNARTGNTINVIRVIDLRMTDISTATTAIARGQAMAITTTVQNTGTSATAGSSYVRLYLSTDTTITTADKPLARYSVTLDAGASRTSTTTVTIPTTIAAGTYYIGAIADYSNLQVETDESNNALAGSAVQIQ